MSQSGVMACPAATCPRPGPEDVHGARRWTTAGSDISSGSASSLTETSAFLRDGDRVFHTYSTYGRGTEQVGGTHYYLDLTALGRQEDWEEPAGRSGGGAPSAFAPGPR
jgi:predicted dithiol-disulfide oxidoreductase (DUF899 family)